MQERLKSFADHVSKQQHIQVLLENRNLCIEISAGVETVYVAIQKGDMKIVEKQHGEQEFVTISGTRESISRLLDGETTLRKAARAGDLQVICSFRTSLLLESVFYLAKPLSVL